MTKLEYAVILLIAVLATSTKRLLSEAKEYNSYGATNDGKRQHACSETALHAAVRLGDSSAITKYAKDGGDLYALDCQDRSAMHLAINDDKKVMITALLAEGFDLNHEFPDGSTVLLFAINNKSDMVHRLIKLGADINAKFGPKNRTFLHSAVENGKLDLIVRLIQFGADADATDKNLDTPLTYAVRKKSPEMVYLLITGGANIKRITKEYGSYLHLAVSESCSQCLKNLLSLALNPDTLDTNGTTALMLAVSLDDVISAVALADSGANVKQKIGKGTLLHLAAQKGSPNSIRWLVEKGLPPDSEDEDGNTPIMLAIAKDDTASAEALASGGAEIQQQCSSGTLLHLAADKGSAKCIRWLIEQGIPPDARNPKGLTPIMLAIQRDDTESLSALDEFGVSLQGNLLHFAVKKGSPNSIRWLIKHGLDPDSKDLEGKTPIVLAVQLDESVSTKILGQSGADLYQRFARGNLLHYAAKMKSSNALRWLTQYGPPVEEKNDDEMKAITIAAGQDDVASMEILADAGADLEAMLNSDDITLLHEAASKNSVKAVRWLVEQGLDVNLTDTARNWNPLYHAAYHSKNQAVKVLIELNSCYTCMDKWGVTPIMRAIENDNTELETILVEGGVDLHQFLEGDSISLLHYAATKGSLKSIRWLVEHGLDIDEEDKPRQWTPLHHAAFHGKLESAKVIVDLQSFINSRDKWGSTPLKLARDYSHPEVESFLETKGGRV